ncbi:MAG: hypothetical protein O9294_16470 [Cytophagales bacterium]|jgi:hypothetical protein|nr:hypothetical protein [Cytophagales bacterium]
MINIFKKKQIKHIQEWEYDLLKNIAQKLPEKYSFLLKQVSKDFILDSVPNEFLNKGWKRTILNQNLYPIYRNNDINYQLVGIKIYDLKDGQQKEVDLDLYEGVLIGYKVQAGEFDFGKIDITALREEIFTPSEQDSKYKQFLSGKKSKHLDLHNGFEIELTGKNYYVIKDLEDGNYLSIDDTGKVYGMFHNPFLVELIHENLSEFIDQVNAGQFSIEQYYKSKVD